MLLVEMRNPSCVKETVQSMGTLATVPVVGGTTWMPLTFLGLAAAAFGFVSFTLGFASFVVFTGLATLGFVAFDGGGVPTLTVAGESLVALTSWMEGLLCFLRILVALVAAPKILKKQSN